MSKLRIYMLLAGLLLMSAVCNAEENGTSQGFGMHFGNVSGNGYSWRIIGEKLGVQLVVGGLTSGNSDYYLPDSFYSYEPLPSPYVKRDNGRKYSFNSGLNLILPLKNREGMMFYLHGGINWMYSDTKQYKRLYVVDTGNANTFDAAGDVLTGHKIRSYVNIGMGPGFEYYVSKSFKIALELPMTYTGKGEFIMYIPQAGLYYYYK